MITNETIHLSQPTFGLAIFLLSPFRLLSYFVEYDKISIVRLEQRRDSLVVVLSGNGKEFI